MLTALKIMGLNFCKPYKVLAIGSNLALILKLMFRYIQFIVTILAGRFYAANSRC
jgi:hypothetical protein